MEFILNQLKNLLFETLDGYILSQDPKNEILRTYVDTFNTAFLLVVQSYWKNCYENMGVRII